MVSVWVVGGGIGISVLFLAYEKWKYFHEQTNQKPKKIKCPDNLKDLLNCFIIVVLN